MAETRVETASALVTVRDPAFQEAEGMVVIEAENFKYSDQRNDPAPWAVATERSGFLGRATFRIP